MKKIVYTRFLLVALAIGSMFNAAFSQAVGDYGSKATGSWTAFATTWEVCTVAGTWVGAAAATVSPTITTNVWIRNSKIITLASGGSAYNCLNLTIESGSTMTGASTVLTPSYLRVYGAIQMDGTLTPNTVSFDLYAPTKVKISSANSTPLEVVRLKNNVSGLELEVDANIKVAYAGSTAGTASAGITPGTNLAFTITINAGKTLTTAEGGYIAAGGSGSADGSNGDIFIINVKGTLIVGGFAAGGLATGDHLNLRNKATKPTTLNILNGGTVTVNGNIYAEAASAASAINIKIESNGTQPALTATGTFNVDGTNIEYIGTSAMNAITGLATVKSLAINNSGGVTLGATTTVTGALTLTAGNLTLGANSLTAGSFVGGTTSSHVIATGAGYLKSPMTAATAKVFPVGAPGISYDPVSISPANAVTCGAKVKDVMSNPVGNGDPTQVVKREWDLFTSAPQGTTDLVFTPDAMATDLAGGIYVLPVGAARVGHLTGGVWDTLVAVNCASGVWTVTGYGGTFSPFVVGSSLAILAIDLLNFTVKTAGTTNQLAWATATERNNTAFDIQRSPNGTDFTTISNVKGRGTTNTVSDYTFTDNTPLNGINYYRLRAVDMDGKATLSKNIAVINGTSKSDIVKVYPTVADAVLTVETISDESTTLKIMDIMGKTVLTKTLTATGFSSNPIDVSGLTNGLYILSFESATTRNTQKFIKN
jgi:fibronectin-binding autotransporter adhesin